MVDAIDGGGQRGQTVVLITTTNNPNAQQVSQTPFPIQPTFGGQQNTNTFGTQSVNGQQGTLSTQTFPPTVNVGMQGNSIVPLPSEASVQDFTANVLENANANSPVVAIGVCNLMISFIRYTFDIYKPVPLLQGGFAPNSVRYVIISGNEDGRFSINPTT